LGLEHLFSNILFVDAIPVTYGTPSLFYPSLGTNFVDPFLGWKIYGGGTVIC
jgi:hypothetical protein